MDPDSFAFGFLLATLLTPLIWLVADIANTPLPSKDPPKRP